LEKQFKLGMNWDNYGRSGWHIDHIKPCASFDLTKKEEQLKCFHYTNLQPLWARENLIKSDKIL
jgi:desulfoferrodoxin (superoxide reductase-like protein)